tara:strand:- start:2471 stop:4747 length:2277 start_codon:yes stop_codon:yes gene_type:complete
MTEATQTKEVNTMSQKYQALQAYTEQKDSYNSQTEWPTLHSCAVHLVPTGDDLPDDINAFVDEKVVQLIAEVQERFSQTTYPLFVRACPLVPRPGVLESSRADTLLDVEVIAHRIITTMMSPDTSDDPHYEHGFTDPHGTVMVQPFINANASAVVAPNNYILMGRDNDGITAGKDGLRVAIPMTQDTNLNRDFQVLGLDPNHIEIEFVSELTSDNLRKSLRVSNTHGVVQKMAMVQLRGSEGHRPIAPPPKGVDISGTFHGADRISINHIHLVSDNTDEQLNEMEDALRAGMPEGSVVLHPNGNHVSHHAGQCYKYGVPYIASTEPQVGEQWTQAALGWVVLDNDGTFEPQPYDPLDFADEFTKGFAVGFTNYARLHGWLSTSFHQFIGGPLHDPAETAYLGGAYVAWLINATLSVGFGELRHLNHNAMGATALPFATIAAVYGVDNWKEVSGFDGALTNERQHYYTMIENTPATMDSVIGLLEFAEDCYKLDWDSSYGGAKYGKSCKNARLLVEAMKSFITKPTEKKFKEVISTANLTEHNVHNNGFFFNKFISKTALDWGTNPDLVRVRPRDFFSVYYAAKDIMDSKFREGRDFTDILDLCKSTTLSSLKAKPLALHDNALGKVMSFIPQSMRHPRGKYSQIDSSTFIMCGVHGCPKCKEHSNYLQSQLSTQILPINKSYDASFPVNEDVSLTMTYKSLSKEEDIDAVIPILSHMLKENPPPKDAEKYVSLIVSKFNTEQLQAFAVSHKDDLLGDE